MTRIHLSASIVLIFCLLVSCSGNGDLTTQPGQIDSGSTVPSQPEDAFPAQLPQDALQPWESIERGALAIDGSSDFTPGRDWFNASTTGVSENGEAARIESETGDHAFGIWRIPLGGSEPGTLSVDANLLADGSSRSSFYIGVANYGQGRWDWQGPFSDSHVRLSLAKQIASGGSFLSSVQNTFVCLLVNNGNSMDVVGLGLNPFDADDSTAPDTPAGLSAIPVTGGLELQWLPVIAADLAGYRIYHADRPFMNPHSAGVRQLDSLEGSTRALLAGLSGTTYLRMSALDHSGNESPASELLSAQPLPGLAPELIVTTDLVSGTLGSNASLSASGADTYDFDTNGDGMFDVTGNTTGTAGIDTTATGIIRPRVRGTSSGGEAVALGAVSLIISGNSRPVASATADPQSGDAPLDVTFTGMAQDGEDEASALSYAWDFDGDGIYEAGTDTLTPAAQLYSTPGTYNAKFRATDSEGAWDVDTLTINVTGTDPELPTPTAALSTDKTSSAAPFLINFDASASQDHLANPVVHFEWDFNGDGAYEASGPSPTASHVYPVAGVYSPQVRVTAANGGRDTASVVISLPGDWPMVGLTPLCQRRTALVGSQSNNVKWSYNAGDDISSSPVIGPDGTIYIGCWDDKLYAIGPDGEYKWDYTLSGAVNSTPAVGHDGTVYVGEYNSGDMIALNPDGSHRWTYTGGSSMQGFITVGTDQTIYYDGGAGILTALRPDGTKKWESDVGASGGTPAIAPDGTIYVGSYDDNIYAVNPDGTEKWSYLTGGDVYAGPAVGDDGTIYCGSWDGNLYALNPNGTLKWPFTTGDQNSASPAIAADGTIYLTCENGTLYAINPDGTEQWTFETGGLIFASPAIDGIGTIYVGSVDNKMYALNPDGTELWSFTTLAQVYSSAAITADGCVVIGGWDGNVYAFGPAP